MGDKILSHQNTFWKAQHAFRCYKLSLADFKNVYKKLKMLKQKMSKVRKAV